MRKWLYSLRYERNLTMKQLGEMIGVSESNYCSIENGNRQKKMDITVINRLAAALEIPAAEVLRLETEYLQGEE